MTPADELVDAIVLAARAMNASSQGHLLSIGETYYGLKVMITTQEELDGSCSWWIRLVTNTMEPIRSWHAVGQFGLMTAATQLSMHVYPFKGGSL